jgi:pimeloyl-ACP methyl ester carboxylesterase
MLALKTTQAGEPLAAAALPDDIISRFIGADSTSAARFPTGQHPCQGLYWARKDHQPSVVFMLSHYIADYMEHYMAVPLAARGYGVLGWNTRYRGAEDSFILDTALEDLDVGVRWIRSEISPKQVIFIGNSGGGSLMAALQARAETDGTLAGADAFIFLNAHPGRADVLSKWIDPSVIDENDPVATDSTLDMYSPDNRPPYSEAFIERYRTAQRKRSQRITSWVKKELQRLDEVGIHDRVFNVHRTMADLRFLDTSIDPSNRPHPACYAGDPARANREIGMVARSPSLRTWLSMWSLEDSKACFEHTGPAFKVPALVIQGTADVGVYPSDAQRIFELLGSVDKEIHLIPGAHFFEDSHRSLDRAVDLISSWVDSRL